MNNLNSEQTESTASTEQATKNSQKKLHRNIVVKCFFLSILFTIAVGIFLIGLFVTGNKLENLLFYARVPLKDGSSLAIRNCVYFCMPAIAAIFVIANIIPHIVIRKREKIKAISQKSKCGIPLKQIQFFYNHGFLVSSIAIVVAVVFLGFQTSAWSYISGMFRTTQIYEEKYVAPQDQKYVFPEEKKNLVYIFLESMETSYASVEEGGFMEESYIPNLTRLAKENISFSDTETLGGAQPITGTAWTVAGMVSQTSGVPLTIPISKSNFGKDDTFLPGVYSIGQILEQAGYNQTLMVGSKATFAKRKDYFEEHGNYKIFDYYTAQERWTQTGELPEDYYVWWGFEDFRLFDYAKEELTELASKDEPFNFTMLTVDTHFTNGYQCEYCEENFEQQYANVISCSDRQVSDFVEWIQNDLDKIVGKEVAKNTVIVISGDHLTMDHSYFDFLDDETKERGRRIYNCFINTGLSDKHTKNRVFSSLDMFPTTLASLGVKWGKNQLGLGVNLFSGAHTLSEEMGLDEFSYHLASSSDFYSDYIMDKNYQKYTLKPDEYEDETGPSADSRESELILELERLRKEKLNEILSDASPAIFEKSSTSDADEVE